MKDCNECSFSILSIFPRRPRDSRWGTLGRKTRTIVIHPSLLICIANNFPRHPRDYWWRSSFCQEDKFDSTSSFLIRNQFRQCSNGTTPLITGEIARLDRHMTQPKDAIAVHKSSNSWEKQSNAESNLTRQGFGSRKQKSNCQGILQPRTNVFRFSGLLDWKRASLEYLNGRWRSESLVQVQDSKNGGFWSIC